MTSISQEQTPRRVRWSPEEDALLTNSGNLPYASVAVALKALGQTRSESAVVARRALLGLDRLARFSDLATACRNAERRRMDGWPILLGSDEERDAWFVRRLLEEQLRAYRITAA